VVEVVGFHPRDIGAAVAVHFCTADVSEDLEFLVELSLAIRLDHPLHEVLLVPGEILPRYWPHSCISP